MEKNGISFQINFRNISIYYRRIANQYTGIFFISSSILHVHFPIKSRSMEIKLCMCNLVRIKKMFSSKLEFKMLFASYLLIRNVLYILQMASWNVTVIARCNWKKEYKFWCGQVKFHSHTCIYAFSTKLIY